MYMYTPMYKSINTKIHIYILIHSHTYTNLFDMNCGSLRERQVDAKSKLSKNQVLNNKLKSIRNQVNAKHFYDNPPIPQHEVENIVF